jgi:hypothetical protein
MPNANNSELPAAESPRNCVVVYQLGPNKTLLVSFDANGDVYEEFHTRSGVATAAEEAILLRRVLALQAPPLRIV